MGDDDWDLQAVVRSCRALPAAERDPFSLLLPLSFPEVPNGGAEICFSGGAAVHVPELEELYRPFFPKTQMQPQQKQQSLLSPHRNTCSSSPPAAAPAPQRPRQQQQQRPAVSHHSRTKKRKNQPKRVVCHVPADGASADLWAWRKYGQKPIKGSPYPRGYYRCSSSKGCPARKQVERNRTDPGTLLVTYTAEHNHPVPTHRNSLAGSTRVKFPTPAAATPPPPPENPSTSSPVSSGLSPTTPLTASMEEEEDEDGVLVVEDMEVAGEDELLFVGGTGSGSSAVTSSFFDDDGWFEEHFSAPPWMNETAAAGGD